MDFLFEKEATNEILIDLNPYYGQYKIFGKINDMPCDSNFQWSGANSIHVYSTDLVNSNHGIFFIVVTKSNIEDISPHLFSIKFSIGGFSQLLVEKYADFGELRGNETSFYKLPFSFVDSNFTLFLTSLAGNANLYASIDQKNQFPSPMEFSYRSEAYDSNKISISYNTLDFERHSNIAVACKNENCYYSIYASRGKTNYLPVNGKPQNGELISLKKDKYFVQSIAKTFIMIQPKQASLNAFASKIMQDGSQSNPILSFEIGKAAVIELQNSSYIVTIYSNLSISSYYNSLRYAILAYDTTIELVEGQTYVDYVDLSIKKSYTYKHFCNDCNMEVSINPLSDCEPYISSSKMINPYYKSFKSISVGNYYVQVRNSEKCFYAITLTGIGMQELSLGIPVPISLKSKEKRKFIYYSSGNSSITIKGIMYSGRIAIKAKISSPYKKSKWSSIKRKTDNFLLLPNTDPSFDNKGTYFICVKAEEAASFDLIVEQDGFSYLSYGRIYSSFLKEKENLHLAFIAAEKKSVKLNIRTLYGQVTGNISLTRSEGKNSWKLQENMNIINTNDPNFEIGNYYISIQALQESHIEIELIPDTRLKLLSDGVPQPDIISPNKVNYYSYNMPPYQNRLSVFASFSDSFQDAIISIEDYENHKSNVIQMGFDSVLQYLGNSVHLSNSSSRTITIALKANLKENESKKNAEIIAWSGNTAFINPEIQYVNTISKPYEKQIYAVAFNNLTEMYVEIAPCIGSFDIFATKASGQAFEFNESNYEIKDYDNFKGKIYYRLYNAIGTYNILVKAVEPIPEIDGYWYTIKVINSTEKNIFDSEFFLEKQRRY